MESRTLDVETLINLVEERRCLWDTDDGGYSNRDLGRLMWKEIAKILESTHGNVKSKWQNLRDTYRRELIKSYQSEGSSKWRHLQSMNFLYDIYYPKLQGIVARQQSESEETAANEDPLEPCIDYEEQDEQIKRESIDVIDGIIPNTRPHRITKRKRIDQNDDTIGSNKNIVQLDNAQIAHLRESFADKDETKRDEDYFFVMSLLPHLRSIPQNQKLRMRIKLEQVLLEGQLNDI